MIGHVAEAEIHPVTGQRMHHVRRIADYPALSAYLARTYRTPGIAETVNIDHIKRGYYSIKALNPNGIVPLGPQLDWL